MNEDQTSHGNGDWDFNTENINQPQLKRIGTHSSQTDEQERHSSCEQQCNQSWTCCVSEEHRCNNSDSKERQNDARTMLNVAQLKIHLACWTCSLGPLLLFLSKFNHGRVNELNSGFFCDLIVCNLDALLTLEFLNTFIASSDWTKAWTPFALDCEISSRADEREESHGREKLDFERNTGEQHHANHRYSRKSRWQQFVHPCDATQVVEECTQWDEPHHHGILWDWWKPRRIGQLKRGLITQCWYCQETTHHKKLECDDAVGLVSLCFVLVLKKSVGVCQEQRTSCNHRCSKHGRMTKLPTKVKCKDAPCDQHGSWLTTMLSKCDKCSMEDEDCGHNPDKSPCR